MTDGLTFDMSKVGTRWKLQFRRASTLQQRAAKRYDETIEDLDATDEAVDEAWDAFEAQYGHVTDMMMQLVVDVPRDWLVADAPSDIDWQAGGSFGYVRADREAEFLSAFGEVVGNPAGK